MDLRLVEYAAYLAAAVPLTVWAGRMLHRAVWLVGLGGVALLLPLDVPVAGAADVVRVVALKIGLLLLGLGALHLGTLLVLRRVHREDAEPARRPAEYEPLRAASGRFPY
jgi:hypothetical protein